MKRAVILISLLLLLTSFILRTKNTQTISATKVPQTIALIHDGQLYYIRVKLNNKTANLLIDTGAAASLLDINQADYYDFTYQESPHTFSGIGGLSEGYRLWNYKIAYDSTKLQLYPFGADLKHVVESFNQKGMTIVGVIGSDFLRTNDAIIDYKKKTLIINNP